MRIIIAGAATALLSFAAATPAYAQFGGSPDAQVDGAPGTRTQAPAQDDEDDQAVAPEADDQGEISLTTTGTGDYEFVVFADGVAQHVDTHITGAEDHVALVVPPRG